jgi:hypothetical protein
MSRRPRSGSSGGEALRQVVNLAQYGIPGNNASAAVVDELRARVLAAARTVNPALTELPEEWGNSALGTTFRLPPEMTAAVAQVKAAMQEEFAGAATVEVATVEVANGRYKTLKEKAEAIVVRVMAKAVKASLWEAARAAAPYVLAGLLVLCLLWVIW